MTGTGESRMVSAGELPLPELLYGRDAAYGRLMSAWREVRDGARVLAVVSGYSGVGKTAIVRQLREPLCGDGAAFISGKYDQVRRSTPYVAIAEALTEYARGLERLPPHRIEAIRAAMGGLARVIVDLVPALAEVLGNPAPVAALPGIEARHRCAIAFSNFIAAASGPEHPLCLFLDDLQWVDGASLDLLRAVLCDETQVAHGGLLVVATYRDNEVGVSHPFARIVADAEAVGMSVQRISLTGLARNEVRTFLSDTLAGPAAGLAREPIMALADALHAKTAGNPFFLRMLLLHLHSTGVLCRTSGEWHWQADAVARLGVADNVADLMSARLHRLAAPVRHTLAIGASLGRSFPLALLAAATDIDATALTALPQGPLAIAKREGLIDFETGPQGSASFGHDRIQQAALVLSTPEQLAEMRLTVGRRLLGASAPGSIGEHLFIIASQFLGAEDRMEDSEERLRIAQLHLCAGRQARAAAAFSAACEFLEAGIALLPDDAWAKHPVLALALHRDAMLSAVTDARHERAAVLFDVLLAKVDDAVDLAECASFRVMQLSMFGRYQDALDLGLDFFGRLGFPIDVECVDGEVERLLDEARDFLQEPGALEQIAAQPMTTDPRLVAAVKLGIFLTPTAFFVDMRIHNLIVLRGFSWALGHGPCTATPAYMVRLNLMFISCRQDYSLASRVGPAAIAAARRFGDPHWLGDALFIHALFGSHWHAPLRAALPFAEEGLARLRETGDLQMSRFYITLPIAIECGDPLEQALTVADAAIAEARRSRARHLELLFLPQRQLILTLLGQAPDSFDELWRAVEAAPMARTCYLICRLQLAVLTGDWENAARFADEAESSLWSITGFLSNATHRFYAGVARYMAASSAAGTRREALLRQAEVDLSQMRAWARSNPQTFEHRALLMEAQALCNEGSSDPAMQLFARAAELARAGGFFHDEALAHELAGRHLGERGESMQARTCLAASRQAFATWGATTQELRLAAELS